MTARARKENPADQPHAREHNVSLRLGRHHLISEDGRNVDSYHHLLLCFLLRFHLRRRRLRHLRRFSPDSGFVGSSHVEFSRVQGYRRELGGSHGTCWTPRWLRMCSANCLTRLCYAADNHDRRKLSFPQWPSVERVPLLYGSHVRSQCLRGGGSPHYPFGHRHRRVPRLAPHPGHRRRRVLLRLAPGNRPTREGSTTTTRRRACLGLFLAFLQKTFCLKVSAHQIIG